MARTESAAKAAYWRGVIERQAGSGATVVEFCERAGISTASLYAWKRRLARQQGEAGGDPDRDGATLVPVRLIPDTAPVALAVELPGGIVLRLPLACDGQTTRPVDNLRPVQKTKLNIRHSREWLLLQQSSAKQVYAFHPHASFGRP